MEYNDKNRPANPGYAHQNLIIPNGAPEDLAKVYKKFLEIRYSLTPEQVTRLWTAVVPDLNDDNSIYYQAIDSLTPKTVALAKSTIFNEESEKKKFGVYRKGRPLKIPDESGKLVKVYAATSYIDPENWVRVGTDRMAQEQIEVPRALIDRYNTPDLIDYLAQVKDDTYDTVTSIKALPWIVLSLGQIHPDISKGEVIWIANRYAPIHVHPRQVTSEKNVRNKYEVLYEAIEKKGFSRITQATLYEFLPEDKRRQGKTRATWEELSKGADPLFPPLQEGQPNLEFDFMVPNVYFGPLSEGKMVVIDHHRRLAASALGIPIEITMSRDDDDYNSV